MQNCYKTLNDIALILDSTQESIPIVKQLSPKDSPRAIGLDFGLNLGFAYAFTQVKSTPSAWYIFPQAIGVLNLDQSRYESGSTIFLRLRDLLNVVSPSIIFYEDVKFTPSFDESVNVNIVVRRMAAPFELLTALRQTCLLWAEDHNIPMFGISIGTIKKTATGSGKANKFAVITACNEKFKTEFDPDTRGVDNAADAAFVLYAGLLQYGQTLFPNQNQT